MRLKGLKELHNAIKNRYLIIQKRSQKTYAPKPAESSTRFRVLLILINMKALGYALLGLGSFLSQEGQGPQSATSRDGDDSIEGHNFEGEQHM